MKKYLWVLLLALSAWSEPDSLIPPDPGYNNAFARGNPGYRKRAAESYEKAYFPAALAQLRRATGLPEPELHRLLQGFSYRWLDRYVELEGHMPADHLAEVVGWLDAQMRQRLHPKPTGSYERWKSSPDNTLAFLFRVH